MGQVPTLEVGEQVICQSNAIQRYVATEHGFYGNDNLEKAFIDQVLETMNEIGVEGTKIIYYSNFDEPTKRVKLAQMYLSDKFKSKMNFFVELLKKNGDGGEGFFVGNKVYSKYCLGSLSLSNF